MDSTSILDSFLLSQSELKHIIKYEQLRKWLPNSSNESAEDVYSAMEAKRNGNITTVKTNIRHEFDVPVTGIIEEMNEFQESNGSLTLESLIRNLKDTHKVALVQGDILDKQIEQYTKEVEMLIKIVGDLVSQTEKEPVVSTAEAKESLERVSKTVDDSLES